jgi:hypothetical protein
MPVEGPESPSAVSPAERSIQDALDRYNGCQAAYDMRRSFIHRKAIDSEGYRRELTLAEVRRIEAAAIEVRDALRELLR